MAGAGAGRLPRRYEPWVFRRGRGLPQDLEERRLRLQPAVSVDQPQEDQDLHHPFPGKEGIQVAAGGEGDPAPASAVLVQVVMEAEGKVLLEALVAPLLGGLDVGGRQVQEELEVGGGCGEGAFPLQSGPVWLAVPVGWAGP